jgi:hypothetical protein
MTDEMVLAAFLKWYTPYANIGREADKQFDQTGIIRNDGQHYHIMPTRRYIDKHDGSVSGWIFGPHVWWTLDDMRRVIELVVIYCLKR